jgi:hypothetical protein
MVTLNIHNVLVPSSLSKEDAIKAFKSVTKEDVIEVRLFEARLWEKYTHEGRNRKGDITRCYWNPINRTMFIGMEGTKFAYLPKDIPLPKRWKVVIRNIWDEKYAYEYPKGKRWLLESDEYDSMERPIVFSALEWCLGNKVDLMQLDVWAYSIMEKNGEIRKGTTEEMQKYIRKS